MGIHGLLSQIGHGERISLAKLSSQYYSTNSRPFRLAIDISIWLFQIQSGKGGSNPALRTFYYRLLRLLSLNIHPLFVFDGPNKPLFKRNKKVGGPGVRVASVPEFLAKQLLKQFGFPWHVAPGEAEAECALLQREGIVDAVLSEDVDTLMFGSGVTLRNWTAENSTKSPTHVDLHRAEATKAKSGMEREGMILVALMSGGDYLPEGIPGCGVKVACDAARAGFGWELCRLGKKDAAGLNNWKERLVHEVRTNESKFFSRRNTGFSIPEDFPNREVLGFYTHPCVSTPEKLQRLRTELRWDQPIDFQALRTFTADAFDWRCVGGAKKFIKNLAPALLVRELRVQGQSDDQLDQEAQEQKEDQFVHAIHGKRNHNTTDGELEYRISFTPASFVPIDLSLEDEDDEFVPAGGAAEDSDAESEVIPSTQAVDDNDSEAPASPSKKRNFRPYYPEQPEKLWLLKPFLQIGCPLLVEVYEASLKDPRELLKSRRKARAAAKGDTNIHATQQKPRKNKAKEVVTDMPQNALMAYAQVTKAKAMSGRAMKELSPEANARSNSQPTQQNDMDGDDFAAVAKFKMPSTQLPPELFPKIVPTVSACQQVETLHMATSSRPTRQRQSSMERCLDPARPFAAFAAKQPKKKQSSKDRAQGDILKTPRRNSKKRPSPDLSSPSASQRTITSYYSPSPRKPAPLRFDVSNQEGNIVNLISSSPACTATSKGEQVRVDRPLTPTPPNTRFQFIRSSASPPVRSGFSLDKLPDSVTKRRRKAPLKRCQTEPPLGYDDDGDHDLLPLPTPTSREATPVDEDRRTGITEVMDLITSTPVKSDDDLPSPSTFIHISQVQVADIDGLHDQDVERTAKASTNMILGLSSPPASPSQQAQTADLWDDHDNEGGFIRDANEHGVPLVEEAPPSSYPTPPSQDDDDNELLPMHDPPTAAAAIVKNSTRKHEAPKTASAERPLRQSPRQHAKSATVSTQALRRSPRQQLKKKRIELRESLEGAWREVDAEMLDMTGDRSGWKKSGGKAKLPQGWRKSGVEVLDLTGA